MRFQRLTETWNEIQQENRLHRWLLVGLTLSNLCLGILALNRDHTLVLVPPHLTEPVQLARNQASQGLKESWGLYIAELIGNVTPENIEFIREALGNLLAADLYRAVLDGLWDQTQALKDERISLSFKPQEVLYESETDRVFVTGTLVTQSPGGTPDRRNRTYEMTVDIDHYHPRIRSLDVYAEEPRVLSNTHLRRKTDAPKNPPP